MEVLDELMESEVSIVVPHITEIVRFCLEVGCKNHNFFLRPFVILLQRQEMNLFLDLTEHCTNFMYWR